MAVLKDERKQYIQWRVRVKDDAPNVQPHMLQDEHFKKVEQMTELPVKIEEDKVEILNSQSGNSGFRWFLVEEEKPAAKAGRPAKTDNKTEE